MVKLLRIFTIKYSCVQTFIMKMITFYLKHKIDSNILYNSTLVTSFSVFKLGTYVDFQFLKNTHHTLIVITYAYVVIKESSIIDLLHN